MNTGPTYSDNLVPMPAVPQHAGHLHDRDALREIGMTSTDFSAVCEEITNALTEVLAENAVGLARRGRLQGHALRTRGILTNSEHAYFLAVETAFKKAA